MPEAPEVQQVAETPTPSKGSGVAFHIILILLILLGVGLLYWKLDSDTSAIRSEIDAMKMDVESGAMMQGQLDEMAMMLEEKETMLEEAMMEEEKPEQEVEIGSDFFMNEGERVSVIATGEIRTRLGTITLTESTGLRTDLQIEREGQTVNITLEQGVTACLETLIGAINLKANSDTQAAFFIAFGCGE